MNIMNIDDLETGDMLLFNGYYFLSRLIEYFTDSIYSHVGVIIVDPTFDNKILKGIYVLESGYEPVVDVENNRHKYGVQLTDLNTILNNYNGKLFVRKLHCIRSDMFYENLNQIHSDVHNLPYDFDPIDWIKAEFEINIGNVQKRNTFWCSALVVYVYIKLGFLCKNISWTLIKPQDLSSKSNKLLFYNCVLDKDIELLNNSI